MIDGTHTSLEWQTHPGDICVLPVGSFEQHGSHLPIATDNLQAELYGRMIAESLDAALLPTLAFGTCGEHGGFRGSFTLRPETMMQIVRDLADEVQRQGFNILIILNAHGGNFSLGPVVRDINRADRPLKILLTRAWEFRSAELAPEGSGMDIHAGEQETSVILALHPDLVRPERVDMTGDATAIPLLQRDLDTFGVGHFNPTGEVGNPSLATAKKGDAIIASVREQMIPYLRDRIARLRSQWRYSGSGGIAIRTMLESDIPAAMRLKTLARWNQTEADWKRALAANPGGCFVAVQNGRAIGTAVINLHGGGQLAWIAMVLVDPAFRRMGIGTRLLAHALEHLRACPSVKLDASPEGRTVYLKLGFLDEYGLQRLKNTRARPIPHSDSAPALPITSETWAKVLALDREAFGVDRSALLGALWKGDPGLSFYLESEEAVRGYCLGRPGAGFHQIGPVVADTFATAAALVQAALKKLAGNPVLIDVPDAQSELLAALHGAGFVTERRLVRMYYRSNKFAGNPARQFAIAGPEFG